MTVIVTLKCLLMKNTISVFTSYQILLFLIVRLHTIVNFYLNLRCCLSKTRRELLSVNSPPFHARCEERWCGSLGPQVHPVQVHTQSEPPCPTGILHMAALPGQETQPTQGNHGGSIVQQHTPESKDKLVSQFHCSVKYNILYLLM